MDIEEREVSFHEHCKTCKHERLPETESPCFECLEDPVNTYSDKPLRWEARK